MRNPLSLESFSTQLSISAGLIVSGLTGASLLGFMSAPTFLKGTVLVYTVSSPLYKAGILASTMLGFGLIASGLTMMAINLLVNIIIWRRSPELMLDKSTANTEPKASKPMPATTFAPKPTKVNKPSAVEPQLEVPRSLSQAYQHASPKKPAAPQDLPAGNRSPNRTKNDTPW